MRTNDTELSIATLEVDRLEAFIQMMFLAAYADGEVSDAERARFEVEVVRASGGALAPQLVRAIVDHVGVVISDEDRARRLDSLRGKLPEERVRRSVLALAARIVLADDKLVDAERTFLERAAVALELSSADVQRALDDARDLTYPGV
jgi:uncharacterized membrane protein YebE (DUF533 family)